MQTNVIANGTATTPGVPAGNIQVNLITDTEVPDITLQSVTGIVDPKIDINVDPITVEGIPDFLKDDVNLDLENPYIKLKLENGSPADVNLKARMTWTKDGVFNEGSKSVPISMKIQTRLSLSPEMPLRNTISHALQ